MLTWGEWMKVLGDVYRYGVADGKRVANSELLEQVSGPEQVHLESCQSIFCGMIIRCSSTG